MRNNLIITDLERFFSNHRVVVEGGQKLDDFLTYLVSKKDVADEGKITEEAEAAVGSQIHKQIMSSMEGRF